MSDKFANYTFRGRVLLGARGWVFAPLFILCYLDVVADGVVANIKGTMNRDFSVLFSPQKMSA